MRAHRVIALFVGVCCWQSIVTEARPCNKILEDAEDVLALSLGMEALVSTFPACLLPPNPRKPLPGLLAAVVCKYVEVTAEILDLISTIGVISAEKCDELERLMDEQNTVLRDLRKPAVEDSSVNLANLLSSSSPDENPSFPNFAETNFDCEKPCGEQCTELLPNNCVATGTSCDGSNIDCTLKAVETCEPSRDPGLQLCNEFFEEFVDTKSKVVKTASRACSQIVNQVADSCVEAIETDAGCQQLLQYDENVFSACLSICNSAQQACSKCCDGVCAEAACCPQDSNPSGFCPDGETCIEDAPDGVCPPLCDETERCLSGDCPPEGGCCPEDECDDGSCPPADGCCPKVDGQSGSCGDGSCFSDSSNGGCCPSQRCPDGECPGESGCGPAPGSECDIYVCIGEDCSWKKGVVYIKCCAQNDKEGEQCPGFDPNARCTKCVGEQDTCALKCFGVYYGCGWNGKTFRACGLGGCWPENCSTGHSTSTA